MTASDLRPRVNLLVSDLGNLGDALLARVCGDRFRLAGYQASALPYRICADDAHPAVEAAGIPVQPLLPGFWRSLRMAWGADLVIAGGQAVRGTASLGWLAMANLLATVARLSGKEFRMLGIGAGRVDSIAKRLLFRGLLRQAVDICVRDEASAVVLRQMCADPDVAVRVRLTSDLVLAEQFESRDVPGRCVVSPAADLSEARTHDVHQVQAVLQRLRSRGELEEVVLLAHDTRETMDAAAVGQLLPVLQQSLDCPVRVWSSQGDLHQALVEPYQQARWVLTGRLHGVIVGTLCGSRVICLDWSDPKLGAFANRLGAVSASRFLAAGSWPGPARSADLNWNRERYAAMANYLGIRGLHCPRAVFPERRGVTRLSICVRLAAEHGSAAWMLRGMAAQLGEGSEMVVCHETELPSDLANLPATAGGGAGGRVLFVKVPPGPDAASWRHVADRTASGAYRWLLESPARLSPGAIDRVMCALDWWSGVAGLTVNTSDGGANAATPSRGRQLPGTRLFRGRSQAARHVGVLMQQPSNAVVRHVDGTAAGVRLPSGADSEEAFTWGFLSDVSVDFSARAPGDDGLAATGQGHEAPPAGAGVTRPFSADVQRVSRSPLPRGVTRRAG